MYVHCKSISTQKEFKRNSGIKPHKGLLSTPILLLPDLYRLRHYWTMAHRIHCHTDTVTLPPQPPLPHSISRYSYRAILLICCESFETNWRCISQRSSLIFEGAINTCVLYTVLRIRIRDPVPFWPLDPGSGLVFSGSWISDLGPGSQTHIFDSLVTIFWVKSYILYSKIDPHFFLQHFKTKIIFNLMKFVAT